MVCKKCGCDALVKEGDWYKCPNCDAVMFDTEVKVNDIESPSKIMDKIEEADNKDSDNDVNISNDENAKKSKKPKSKTRETVEFFIPIIIAIVIAVILKTLVFANAVVPTGSMLNTIQEKDRIIASRLAYINEDPERYDIVIFKYPDDETQMYVKRIIGLPGETVEIIDGDVYVTKTDGEQIILDDSFVTNCIPEGNYGPYTVPEGCYFMMGDNRNNSWDSRFWDNKYVSKDKIIGKVLFRYYPNISKIE